MHARLITLFFLAISSRAEPLLELESRADLEASAALASGSALIYVDKVCSACQNYLRRLHHCPESVRRRLLIVSLDTPAVAKEWIDSLPAGARLVIRKDPGEAARVPITPLTLSTGSSLTGLLTCDRLAKALK